MNTRKWIFSLAFLLGMISVQAGEIGTIEQRYREWITGSPSLDYSNPLMQKRYGAILDYVKAAHRVYKKHFYTPKEIFDFSTKPNQKEARKIFSEMLFPLSLGYNIPGPADNPNPYYHQEKTLKKILSLFDYLKKKGWVKGIDMHYKNTESYKETGVVGFGGSMGNNFLGYSLSVFLMKDVLAEKGLLEDELETLDWITSPVDIDNDFSVLWEETGFNADGVRAMLNNRFCYLLSLPDSHSRRADEMVYFQRFLNKALSIANGWADLIKPDYTGYHHKGAYYSAYPVNAFHTAGIMAYMLEGTAFQLSREAKSNLAKASLTYRLICQKYDIPRGLAGRFPNNLSGMLKNVPTFAYLSNLDIPEKEAVRGAFARLWDPSVKGVEEELLLRVECRIMYQGSLGALDLVLKLADEEITPEKDPNGYWFKPYMGLSVYRQSDWLVSFKGNSKYIWDFESSKTENLYGRYASAGAMRIYAKGNPISAEASGYAVNGWNWSHVPGTTTFDMPLEKLKSRKTRSFAKTAFLGGVSVTANSGVTGWEYKAPISDLSAHKTLFFYKDYCVALGSDIQSKSTDFSVITTAFQTGLASKNDLTWVNGKQWKGVNKTQKSKGKVLTAVDAAGNAYFFPKNQSVSIGRIMQNSMHQSGRKETSGLFTTALIDHGKAPKNAGYEYVIQVRGGEKGAEKLTNSAKELYRVIQKDKNAHIASFPEASLQQMAIFNCEKELKDDLVKMVSAPCLLAYEEQKGEMNLAVMNPELGKVDRFIKYGDIKTREMWHARSTMQPVEITLKGNWKLAQPTEKIKVLSQNWDHTIIRCECFEGAPLKMKLVK